MKLIQTPSFQLAVYARGDENSTKLALVLPGRLDTKDYIHMTSHVDLLAKHGYYSVSFDPPSSWESPGDPKDYTTSGYLKAVNELIEYFGNKPTLLVGHSRGGAVSMLASDNKHVIGVVLIMASYGNATGPKPQEIKDGQYVTSRDLPPGDTRSEEQIELSLPMSYFDDAKKYTPGLALKEFKGPKLLICGTQDAFFTPEKIKAVYDTLSEPKAFLELDSRHDYRYHPDIIEKINTAIAEFLTTNKLA